SGFEADRSTRLFELWYQQSFLKGKLDVKIGQQDLDTEFLISDYASLYLNANFGWPMAPSVNLYGGGPSWPLSSPAVRIRYRPGEKFTFMFAAADDNPPGNRYNSLPIQQATGAVLGSNSDPTSQTYNGANGTNFNMGNGALLITELQYALNPQPADTSNVTKDPGLPGVYKLGGYYDTARFPDYRYNNMGQALGGPNDTTGIPRWDRGNWMVYGIIDQMIWRPSIQSTRSLGIFVRATGNGGDRNLISFAIDAGLNLKAPFRGRDNDTIGLGWGIGRASSGERQYTRNVARTGTDSLVPGNENHLELTYQAQVTPWLVMQPDFQYVWHPAGGGSDPSYPYRRTGDEAIFGLHSNITF
ncbi:carbohydrate porin, partial [Komagataeibacter oboediens]|uniref:carbohydrate porin n=1 Tax=Komagataeibacter oboediens TaxID=65958 RepID=UPI000237E579